MDYFERIDYGKYRVSLATSKDLFSSRLKEKGIPVEILNFPFQINNPNGSFLNRFKQMFSFLRSQKPDSILYVQGAFTDFKFADFLAGYFAARGSIFSLEVLGANPPPEKTKSRKHFGLLPGIGLWWYKQIFPLAARGWLCKKIITVGDEVRKRTIDWMYPKKKVITVYHGINYNDFSLNKKAIREELRRRLGISNLDTVIISTARLDRIKRIDRLLNAFDAICNEFKNCWLVLAGDGPLRNELEVLSNGKNSKDKIKFLGFQEDVASILKASDIFVLPSDLEGLSFAMQEAMAAGLVCVISKTPGAEEVVQDEVNGFLVDPNQEGVTAGLQNALSLTNEQRESISRNAQDFIRENFDKQKGAKRALEILKLA